MGILKSMGIPILGSCSTEALRLTTVHFVVGQFPTVHLWSVAHQLNWLNSCIGCAIMPSLNIALSIIGIFNSLSLLSLVDGYFKLSGNQVKSIQV